MGTQSPARNTLSSYADPQWESLNVADEFKSTIQAGQIKIVGAD